MGSLYELTGQYRELQQAIESAASPNELEAIMNTLEGMDAELEQRAENVVKVMRNTAANIAAIEAEIDRLKDRKETLENSIKRMQGLLRTSLHKVNKSKVQTPLFLVFLQDAPPKAVIDKEDDIPDDYVKTNITVTPDKTAILNALKAGKEVPGAHMERSEQILKIK